MRLILIAIILFLFVPFEPRCLKADTVLVSQEALLTTPNKNNPTIVKASFYLKNISDIDDETENFQFSGVLKLSWLDPRQAFDPIQVGVNEKIYQGTFQADELSPAWFPQVVLTNGSGLYEKQGTLLRIQPDGSSTLIETIVASAKTSLNMRRYPFDTQKLQAIFEVLGYDRAVVALEVDTSLIHPYDSAIDLSQWKLKDVNSVEGIKSAPYIFKDGTISTFIVNFDVARKSLFMVRLVVLPLALIVILSWSVFWMERSSLGDRINISFIGILTAVAYQFVVGGIIPHISYVTLMHGFLNISFLLMSASVIANLIVGRYDKKGHTNKGDLIDYRCRWLFPVIYFGLLILIAILIFALFE